MTFSLVNGDVMNVPIKLTLNGSNGPSAFAFTLQMRRLSRLEYVDTFSAESEVLSRDFLLDVTQGWRGQRLVVDDSGQPAPYSREAMAYLLDVVGVEGVCLKAYLEAYAQADTAAGRAKN